MRFKASISIIFAVFILCVTAPFAAAQDKIDTDGLLKRCGGYFGLCGYISESDWKNKRIETEVLPKIYEALGDYNEGLAPVRVKGRWGFMDRNGEMKIDPVYTSVSPIDHGLAVIATEAGYGLINKSGELLLPAEFTWLMIYNGDTVLASQSDEISFDPFQRISRYKPKYGATFQYSDSRPVGIYNIKSGWLTPQTLRFRNFDAKSNSHIWAREEGKNSQYGLLNTETGKWHIEPLYDEVREVSERFAVVGAYLSGQSRIGNNKRLGAVNEQGQLVIPLKFKHFNDFWHGFGETRKDGKIALVTKSGNLVAGKYFEDSGRSHSNDTQRMVKDDEGWWKVWPNGTLHPEEGFVFKTCPSGLSFEAYMERTVITHPDGRVLGDDFQSPNPPIRNYFTNELEQKCAAPISIKSAAGKWGFISPTGEFLAGGIIYDNGISFKEAQNGQKYAGFEVDGLWGIMDETGDILHEPQFTSSSEVLENIPGYKPKTSKLEWGSEIDCAAGSRLFLSNHKWGLQDEGGRVLVKAEHDLLTCFAGGTALVPDIDLKQWCPVDREGKRRSDLPCQDKYYPTYSSHTTPEELDPDPWLSNVKWARQYYEYGLGLRDAPPKLIPWE